MLESLAFALQHESYEKGRILLSYMVFDSWNLLQQ